MKFNELSCVKILRNFPKYGIKKGDIGVILTVYKNPFEAYEVEVNDTNGKPKATIVILSSDLELMRYPIENSDC